MKHGFKLQFIFATQSALFALSFLLLAGASAYAYDGQDSHQNSFDHYLRKMKLQSIKFGICMGENLALQAEQGTVTLPTPGQPASTDENAKAALKQAYRSAFQACKQSMISSRNSGNSQNNSNGNSNANPSTSSNTGSTTSNGTSSSSSTGSSLGSSGTLTVSETSL